MPTVTTVEAARRLGVPPQRLYDLIIRGDLAGARNDRGRLVVDIGEARAALELGPEGGDEEPLAAIAEAAADIEEATERRDRAIVAAYESDARPGLDRLAAAAKLSVETVRKTVARMGGELRPPGRPAKSE